MSRWFSALLAGAGVLGAASAGWADGAKETLAMATDTPAFTADLYAKVAEAKGNLFFSPTSIETALAMTYAGAKGTTAAQMAKALHYRLPAEQVSAACAALMETLNHPPTIEAFDPRTEKTIQSPAYQLVVANALWGQQGYPFKPDFTQLLRKSYGADARALDFVHATEQARTTINDWVAAQTKDKIKDLLAKGVLTADTRLVLTNAIYFKSSWQEKFQKPATKKGPFKLAPDQSVDVPLMHQTHGHSYMENDDLQLLELPYTQGVLSMIVLLPKKVDGLSGVERNLTPGNLARWLKDRQNESVEVTLPRFTYSAELSLAATLKAMGMPEAFDSDKADFSGMTSAEKLCISDVIHKAFVAVDEEGTEAAAATAIAFKAMAMPMPREPKIFTADHPFIFLIRHNATGEILFMGRLANPKE